VSAVDITSVCSGHNQFIGEGMATKIKRVYSNFY